MKKVLIIALVCLNVVLLAALAAGLAAPRAQAQTVGGGADYVMVSGYFGPMRGGAVVVDLARRRMAVFTFDKGTRRLIQTNTRDLYRDFDRGQ
jgi:hypothetical protein